METQEFDAVRLKILNCHTLGQLIITKLKTKSSQRIDKCEYKIDTYSDGNLMPIRMYKMFLPHTDINELKMN